MLINIIFKFLSKIFRILILKEITCHVNCITLSFQIIKFIWYIEIWEVNGIIFGDKIGVSNLNLFYQ